MTLLFSRPAVRWSPVAAAPAGLSPRALRAVAASRTGQNFAPSSIFVPQFCKCHENLAFHLWSGGPDDKTCGWSNAAVKAWRRTRRRIGAAGFERRGRAFARVGAEAFIGSALVAD
jgi:hypothetical protein